MIINYIIKNLQEVISMTMIALKPRVITDREYAVEILEAEYNSKNNELTLDVRMHDGETGQTVITQYKFFNKGKAADYLADFMYILYGGYQDGFDSDELVGCQFIGKEISTAWTDNNGVVRNYKNLVALSAGDFLEDETEDEIEDSDGYYDTENNNFEFYEVDEDE